MESMKNTGKAKRIDLVDYVAWGVVLAMVLTLTFEKTRYSIDEYAPEILLVKTTWWGFKEEARPIKWAGDHWSVKGNDKKWRPLYFDDGGGDNAPEPIPGRP